MLKPGERFSHQRMLYRENQRSDPATWTATASDGMVATSHYLATAAAAEMLARGGDAVDAAVAASLALGVCEPASSGLAGMAMMLIHRAAEGRTFALAGACRAPKRATPEAVSSGKRYRGLRAVAVPGHPAVLDKAHTTYGRLSRDAIFLPAIRHAEEGFPLTPLQHSLIRHYRRALRRHSAKRVFLDGNLQPLPAGTLIRQPALAKTLRRLAKAGWRDFYEGEIARRIGEHMESGDGFLRQDDLAEFPLPAESQALRTQFGELTVHTLAPPGGGIALLQMLNLFDQVAGEDFDADTPAGALSLASVIRRTRQDRQRYRLRVGADHPGQGAELLAQDYARKVAGKIKLELAEAGETTHISVADREGNLVSLTQSIERSFGAAEINPELGLLYNGFLRAFKVQNQAHPHYLRPGVVARSNACPTILLKAGQPWGAIGSTGSERLASGILGVLVRLRRQSPFESVLAPRLHCTPNGVVMLEAERFRPETLEALSRQGFELRASDAYSFKFGGLNLVVRQGQAYCGVAEPRRDGTAAGPEEVVTEHDPA